MKTQAVRIPPWAKKAAREGLEERRRNNAGLTKSEAKTLGINSGVERAKQLVREDYVSYSDASRIAAFYSRFQNCRTPRCETAIKLWGGRRWGRWLSMRF